jgi:DNA-binding PucR family transcriptional regulator
MLEDPTTDVPLAALLDDERLGLRLVAGGDRDRRVSWVHATELADPGPWLSGGELLLTTGAWDARDHGVTRFAASLAAAGAAAVGWGFMGAETAVPEAVVAACERAGLAVVAVPIQTPFIAVERSFVERRHERRAATLRATIDRNERLAGALASGSKAVDRLLAVLRDVLGREAWLGPAADPGAAAASWPVTSAPAPGTRLLVGGAGRDLTGDQRAAVEQALPFLRFAVEREQDAARAERRLAAELVDVTLAGQTAFAAARLMAYGLDPQAPLVGVAVEAQPAARAAAITAKALEQLGVDAVVAPYEDAVVAIAEAPGVPLGELGALLADRLGAGAAVGVGSPSAGVEELRRSLVGAREAAVLARRLTRGWALHDEISSHALLLALHDDAVLDTFAANVLGPILEHDRRRGSELLPTLEAFITSGGQWQATADALSMHVNTLRHRIARCEELSGRPLKDMGNRVDVFMALRALRRRA